MAKKMLISGILGGLVMFVATMIFRFLLPIDGRVELLPMPDQVPIHAQLKERITEPGTYVCPYLPPGQQKALFPNYLNEPIFSVSYKGDTHGSVPGFASPGVLAFLLAPMAAAWILAHAAEKILSSYARRVLFVAVLGVFVHLATTLLSSLTEEVPLAAVAGKMAAGIMTWVLTGLVLAWAVRPKSAASF